MRYSEIQDGHAKFIAAQRLFFVATAVAAGRINLSPKGMDSLRVLGPRRVVWLNVTGSGNETSAHVQRDPRITLMFCAFEGSPRILRVYGSARAVHRADTEWAILSTHFPSLAGARQILDVTVELVQTSCGMAVPFFDYVGERTDLSEWAARQGDEGLRRYWSEKNEVSLDGLPTHVSERSGEVTPASVRAPHRRQRPASTNEK
jgi:hypothetical protein